MTSVDTLAGGLRLVTTNLPESPVVAVHLWFEVGAVDEPAGLDGAAHFVEHMVFKGTERRGVGEAATEIEALGGDLNAWTTWDETCFHATLDATAAADAIDVLVDMARRPIFDAGELEREKDVVLSEISGYREDIDSVIEDRLHLELFGAHPYGRPVLGSQDSVRAFDRGRIVDFWRRNYHPGRAVMSVAGPIDRERIAAFVNQRIRGWTVGEARQPVVAPTYSVGTGWHRPTPAFRSAGVGFAWPGPAFGHADVPALYVAWMALANSSSSRLVRRLELDLGVASDIGADTVLTLGGGALTLTFATGHTADAVAETRAVLDEVAAGGIPRSEVVRARESLLSDFRFAGETTESVSADRVMWVARTGDPHGAAAFVRAVAAIEPGDVARVADRWIRPDHATRVIVDPETDLRALDRAWQPRPAPAALRAARVAVAPDRGGIAAIEITGIGGALLDRPSTPGTAEAWVRMLGRGAGPWDTRRLAEHSDQVGVSFDARAGRSMFALHVSFPAEELECAAEILGEVLLDPHFDEADWDNVREELLDDVESRADSPSTIAVEALCEALFPDHPWRLPPLGTERSLTALRPSALLHRHRRLIRAENLAVAVAGGVSEDRAQRAIEPWLRELSRRGGAAPAVPGLPSPPRPGSSVQGGTKRATVIAGVRGYPVAHPDRAIGWILQGLLESQSGRLFLNLREARGLAYGVWGSSESGFGAGVIHAGLSTDASRVDEARAALLHELNRLCDELVPDDELAKVRRMLLGLESMRLQRVAGRAAELARCLRTGEEPGRAAFEARLAEVTPGRLRDACRALGLNAPTVIDVRPQAERARRR